MKKDLSAQDLLRRIYPEDSYSEQFSREVTFQVTENCNLNCSYCYQGCKSGIKMSWDTAKKIVDYLYELWDIDDENGFINKSTKMIILDFIGGEPMLEVELIDKICSYFWSIAIERKHPWAETFMISIATNGTMHFKPEVQKFIYKFKGHLSYGVSIDGPKEMHDSCRVHYDGRGSFDEAYAAQKDFNEHFYSNSGTKATIARANLPYLSTLIKYYVEQGYSQIHANYVYEEEWNYDDAKLLYSEMKIIADYILSLDHEVDISLFEENFFSPMDENDNNNWCGGTGAMLAFDPVGNAFPCIRYMKSSLNGEQKPLIIGNYKDGIYNTDETKKVREELNNITRRSQSTDECFYCPIASGCSWCSGWNYQLYGTANKRCTRICPMHKARSLANVYFWNKKYKKYNINRKFIRHLPDSDSLNIISIDELNLLNQLEN